MLTRTYVTHEQMNFCPLILVLIPYGFMNGGTRSIDLQSAYFITHLSLTPVQNPQDHMLVENKHIVVQTSAKEVEILFVSNDSGKPSFSKRISTNLIWSVSYQ